jgi:hypothetical protein
MDVSYMKVFHERFHKCEATVRQIYAIANKQDIMHVPK